MASISVNFFLASENRKSIADILLFFLNKINDKNKQLVEINFLTGGTCLYDLYTEISNKLFGFHKIRVVKIGDSIKDQTKIINYRNKMDFIFDNNTEFTIKIDDDLILSNFVYDFIIENIKTLNDEDNFWINPIIPTNNATFDYFINKYVDKDTSEKIIKDMLTMNYGEKELLKYTVNSNGSWQPDNFFKTLSTLEDTNQGIHPIKYSKGGHKLINEFIINNFEKIMLINKSKMSFFTTVKQYWNVNFFAIKTSVYKKAFESMLGTKYDSITTDEPELNRYAYENNKKYLFIDNGIALHPCYSFTFKEPSLCYDEFELTCKSILGIIS